MQGRRSPRARSQRALCVRLPVSRHQSAGAKSAVQKRRSKSTLQAIASRVWCALACVVLRVQALQYREKMARSFRMATLAGSKVQEEGRAGSAGVERLLLFATLTRVLPLPRAHTRPAGDAGAPSAGVQAAAQRPPALQLQVRAHLPLSAPRTHTLRTDLKCKVRRDHVLPAPAPIHTRRYRVPEPSGGWVVRPCMEPHGEGEVQQLKPRHQVQPLTLNHLLRSVWWWHMVWAQAWT